MARPRIEYSHHVRKIGPSYIGYYYRYDETGNRKESRRKVAGRDEMTLTKARELHADWVRENVKPQGRIRYNVTLKELWLAHMVGVKEAIAAGKLPAKHEDQQRGLWEILAPLGELAARDITPEQVRQVKNKHVHNLLSALLAVVGNDGIGSRPRPAAESERAFRPLEGNPRFH